MADLKHVYRACSLNAAELAIGHLEAKWGDTYPLLLKSWRNKRITYLLILRAKKLSIK